ncbi:ABC transporter substrate-binding protein [Aquipuribacter sp. SD81]|uniref:ABC transporter substrate-binding protein n=1 Tax=Aquipuribacter sp. SD81 TaxID=3127703 RepID=UPI003018BE56
MRETPSSSRPARRSVLQGTAAAAALGLAGCADQLRTGDGAAAPAAGSAPAVSPGASTGGSARTIRIGYVTPQTGALAPFGEADSFVVDQVTQYFAENGLQTGAGRSDVEIIVKDTQSDSTNAADAASELILDDQVDLVLVGSTPDTTNPVADQCEANGVPCLSSLAPWQPWFLGRGGDPENPFRWTYHFFWGLEDVIAVFTDLWGSVETNRTIGALWPNDPDGNAWGDPELGFPPPAQEAGYTIVDPGFYANGTQDFTAQISAFKEAGAEILIGVPIPPDFTTFWDQAGQQDFRPRMATVGKALLFPSSIAAVGERGNNLSTEVWWSPSHPYTSSLTGQSAAELAEAWTEATGQPWTQPIGFVHALFEVAAAAFAETSGPDDRQGLVDALAGLQVDTVVGTVDWTAGPVPNVAKTKLVGGQWRTGSGEPELVIVSNAQAPEIPTAGEVEALA